LNAAPPEYKFRGLSLPRYSIKIPPKIDEKNYKDKEISFSIIYYYEINEV
jgi:hypothetical protein